ncbi:hypothetical protein SAMN06265375_10133 [Muriicola jejuensis]|uniref:Uncharacterized protein n=1 Tax=Muriicola jejuensis TaxID=504488 RepID=A0A6P0UEV9_9FLAO|nr:hypothetical protein [Muriicola jejuensis]NER10419.1 hypothetical protein [Muriicola jejuensis]SMP00871.1 hypothetical protein SAMN06265375_10133 [Muriicola jejuensis]
MKRIYFDKMDSRSKKVLAIPMIIFLGIYIYSAFNNRGSVLQSVSGIIGFGFFIFLMSKQFFFKNYVGWNRMGLIIKLNSFWPRNINFGDIKSYKIENNRLHILRKNGSEFNFNLENIGVDDENKIRNILNANIFANNV